MEIENISVSDKTTYDDEVKAFLYEYLGQEHVDYLSDDYMILHFPKFKYTREAQPQYSRYVHDLYVCITDDGIAGLEATLEKYVYQKEWVHGHLNSDGRYQYTTFCMGANLPMLFNSWRKTSGAGRIHAFRLFIYYLCNTFLPTETEGPFRRLGDLYIQGDLGKPPVRSEVTIASAKIEYGMIQSVELSGYAFSDTCKEKTHNFVKTAGFIKALKNSETLTTGKHDQTIHLFKGEFINLKIIDNYEYEFSTGEEGYKNYKIDSSHQYFSTVSNWWLDSDQSSYSNFDSETEITDKE